MTDKILFLIDLLMEERKENNKLHELLLKKKEELDKYTNVINDLEKENEFLKNQLYEKPLNNNYYFDSYDAAKKFLCDTISIKETELNTEHDIEAAFVRRGKKLIIKNND